MCCHMEVLNGSGYDRKGLWVPPIDCDPDRSKWDPRRKNLFKTTLNCDPKKQHPLYQCWKSMRHRCGNPKSKHYKLYGAKGIKVCSEWLTWDNFAEWALCNGWKPDLVLDRIDPCMGYHPGNCRFISVSENSSRARVTEVRLDACSANGRRFRKPILCRDNGVVFESISRAAEAFCLDQSNMSRACGSRSHTAGGFRWSRIPKAGFHKESPEFNLTHLWA